MRRQIGIAGLQRSQQKNEQYKETASQIAVHQLDQMQHQMRLFENYLKDFAQKYKKDILKDAAFRAQFQSMCQSIGVDPLSSNKGFFAELLGFGDYYYELGVQIIEICLKTRGENGGLLEYAQLKARLQRSCSDDDIERALKSLNPLGSGYQLIQIGKKKYIQSVPKELSLDHQKVIEKLSSSKFVSEDILEKELNWQLDRCRNILEQMLKEGVVWIDSQVKPAQYWLFTSEYYK